MRLLFLHSYAASMPSRTHRFVSMAILAVVAAVLGLVHRGWLTANAQLAILTALAAWAALVSVWSP